MAAPEPEPEMEEDEFPSAPAWGVRGSVASPGVATSPTVSATGRACAIRMDHRGREVVVTGLGGGPARHSQEVQERITHQVRKVPKRDSSLAEGSERTKKRPHAEEEEGSAEPGAPPTIVLGPLRDEAEEAAYQRLKKARADERRAKAFVGERTEEVPQNSERTLEDLKLSAEAAVAAEATAPGGDEESVGEEPAQRWAAEKHRLLNAYLAVATPVPRVFNPDGSYTTDFTTWKDQLLVLSRQLKDYGLEVPVPMTPSLTPTPSGVEESPAADIHDEAAATAACYEQFDALDVDKSGTLEPMELFTSLFDTDGNGVIQRDEFIEFAQFLTVMNFLTNTEEGQNVNQQAQQVANQSLKTDALLELLEQDARRPQRSSEPTVGAVGLRGKWLMDVDAGVLADG
eukprot:Skav222452  [mRNA]  locus=scaffold3319:230:4451:+ [translate_table: standard]